MPVRIQTDMRIAQHYIQFVRNVNENFSLR